MHRNASILLYVILILCPSVGIADTDTMPQELGAELLRDTFEMPLQVELLKAGFTPRNAATAAQTLLNSLVDCWNSEKNSMAISEPEVIVVRLGDDTIATYQNPCMADFLTDVRALAP